MKKQAIWAAVLITSGMIVLTLEINFLINYFESKFKPQTVSASIMPQRAPVVHAPPAIKSERSQHWEDIYCYIQERNKKVYPKLAAEITDYIIEYSEKYNVHSAIVVSMMDVESNYNYAGISNKNAVGLMQIVYDCWKDDPDFKKVISEERDLFDPELNIKAGCLILGKLRHQHKDIKKYLNAYYGGTGYFEKVSVAFSRFKLTKEYAD